MFLQLIEIVGSVIAIIWMSAIVCNKVRNRIIEDNNKEIERLFREGWHH